MSEESTVVVVVCNPETALGRGAEAALKKSQSLLTLRWGSSLEAAAKSNGGDGTLKRCDVVVMVPGGSLDFARELITIHGARWLHSWFAGVDGVMPLVRELPVDFPCTNSRDGFSRPLMEWVVTMILHFEKDVPRFTRNQSVNRWEQWTVGELHGKTIGFVGFGNIAKETARVCKSLGMKTLALRHRDLPSDHADEVLLSNDPEKTLELYRRSDFVVSSLPHTPTTIKFNGPLQFAAMKPDGVFISIGRGTTVDEVALQEVLSTKSIKGAALDVFEKEPLVESSPLWTLPNIFISSHNADWVPSFADKPLEIFQSNLAIFKAKSPAKHADMASPIDKTLGY